MKIQKKKKEKEKGKKKKKKKRLSKKKKKKKNHKTKKINKEKSLWNVLRGIIEKAENCFYLNKVFYF